MSKLNVNVVINQLLTSKSKDKFPRLAKATEEAQRIAPQVVEMQKIVAALTQKLRAASQELFILKREQEEALLEQADAYMNEFVYVLLKEGPEK